MDTSMVEIGAGHTGSSSPLLFSPSTPLSLPLPLYHSTTYYATTFSIMPTDNRGNSYSYSGSGTNSQVSQPSTRAAPH